MYYKLFEQNLEKKTQNTGETYSLTFSTSDNDVKGFFARLLGGDTSKAEDLFAQASDKIKTQREETIKRYEEEIRETLEVEDEDLRGYDEQLIQQEKLEAYVNKPDLLIPEKTYKSVVRDEITEVSISLTGDSFSGKGFKIKASKEAAYLRLPSSIVPIPHKPLALKDPTIDLAGASTLGHKDLKWLEKDTNLEHKRFLEVADKVLNSVDIDFPKYRKRLDEAYYHPYDTVGRLPRDIADRVYKQHSIRSLLANFQRWREARGHDGKMRVGIIFNGLGEYDDLKQVLHGYEIMTIISPGQPDIVIYLPYSKFPNLSTFSSSVEQIAYYTTIKERVASLAPHWGGCDNFLYGYEGFRLRDWGKIPLRFTIAPCSPHRSRVFIQVSPAVVEPNSFFLDLRDDSYIPLSLRRIYRDWIFSLVTVSARRNRMITKVEKFEKEWEFWYSYEMDDIDTVFHRWYPGLLHSPIRTVSFFAPLGKRKGKTRVSDVEFQFLAKMDGFLYREEAFYDAGIGRSDLERLVYSGRLRVHPIYGQLFYGLESHLLLLPEKYEPEEQIPRVSVIFSDTAINVDYDSFLTSPNILPVDFDTVRKVVRTAIGFKPAPGILFSSADQRNVIIKLSLIHI